MEIIELKSTDDPMIKSFKEKEWAQADKDHYGDSYPDFERHKTVLVAKEGEEILGYVSFCVEAGITLMGSIIVRKKSRNQGIAKKLIADMEKKAKDLGAHKVWLETGVDWGARSLYEKLGYETRSILPDHYGHKDFVLMDKML